MLTKAKEEAVSKSGYRGWYGKQEATGKWDCENEEAAQRRAKYFGRNTTLTERNSSDAIEETRKSIFTGVRKKPTGYIVAICVSFMKSRTTNVLIKYDTQQMIFYCQRFETFHWKCSFSCEYFIVPCKIWRVIQLFYTHACFIYKSLSWLSNYNRVL